MKEDDVVGVARELRFVEVVDVVVNAVPDAFLGRQVPGDVDRSRRAVEGIDLPADPPPDQVALERAGAAADAQSAAEAACAEELEKPIHGPDVRRTADRRIDVFADRWVGHPTDVRRCDRLLVPELRRRILLFFFAHGRAFSHTDLPLAGRVRPACAGLTRTRLFRCY